MFGRTEEFVLEHGAAMLKAVVPEDDPAGMQFATSLAFSVERHEYESRIDLATWDEARFADKLAEVEALGVRLFSYADEPREAALYELAKRNSVDGRVLT